MNGIGPRLDRLIEIMNDWNFKFTSSDRGGDPSGMYLEHYFERDLGTEEKKKLKRDP
jgi:hypothetical protein